jgi:SAM-dependent methyltransferase
MAYQIGRPGELGNQPFAVPNKAVLYILLQRTAYQTKTLSRLLRRVPGFWSLIYARVEALLRRSVVKEKYVKGIWSDFEGIRSGLPQSCHAILDIGCGVAGINALLYQHYHADQPEIYLSDYHAIDERIYYGFQEQPVAYNSLDVSHALLTANGVPHRKIHYIPPSELSEQISKSSIDLVLSILAWGYHFPIETYLSVVHSALADQGRLILDLRRDTDGMKSVAEVFQIERVLIEMDKYSRLVAYK